MGTGGGSSVPLIDCNCLLLLIAAKEPATTTSQPDINAMWVQPGTDKLIERDSSINALSGPSQFASVF